MLVTNNPEWLWFYLMFTGNENARYDAAFHVLVMLILMLIIPYRKCFKHEHNYRRVKPFHTYVCVKFCFLITIAI